MSRAPLAAGPETRSLPRELGTAAALGANIIDMVGVGPFITLPLLVSAMGGPQALLGWLAGALLSLADGCVWSELGTAHPQAGGSYAYLRNGFGRRLGRLFAFLYAWQLLFSAPLSIASGCVGFAGYASWFFPNAGRLPLTLLAMLACVLCTALLLGPIRRVGRLTRIMGAAVVLTLVAVIVVGFSQPRLVTVGHIDMHGDMHGGTGGFLHGLGAGLLITAYDFWGYYNVCFLGGELRDPSRTIPRAVLGSVTIVGTLYLLMNLAVLRILPWQPMAAAAQANTRPYTMAIFAETALRAHTYAHLAGSVTVVLVAVASLASVFALLLGYSRIPFAAAADGNFPAWFVRLHPRHRSPRNALLALAGATVACCLFHLQELIASLVVLRILFQFLLQGVAVLLPAHRRERHRPGSFRMPLYPLPALLAMGGFLFILLARQHLAAELRLAVAVLLSGVAIYALRARRAAGA